ncbi:hypothetical protein [Mesorhizobium sp. L-8-3]|uniref:hypothetical protein n=1 Tax=Mesorhizobium sp. L-8-3 TaxID=2744522 RepID=UPI00237B9CEF|nr:hypothetical protein [Mesorhizobium sp. L-8-3]
MHLAPRCTAKSKRSGFQCKAPAVRGKKVCRMHGARGGAPCGSLHGRYVHGKQTRKAIEARRETRDLIQKALQLLASIEI